MKAEAERQVILTNNKAFGSNTWSEATIQAIGEFLRSKGKANITELDDDQKRALMKIVKPKCHQGHTINDCVGRRSF